MKNKFIKILYNYVIILLILNTITTVANDPVILRQISIEQRLPGVSLQCIYQDSKGIMWFGLESVGLCKFDGQDYTIYENKANDSTSISNNFASSIKEDNSGSIWVGTLNGLNEFNREKGTFTRYFHEENNQNSIPDNCINEIIEDSYGYLWIATSNGLCKYHKEKKEYVHLLRTEENQLDKINVSTIYEDLEGNIWIGTWQKGLLLISARTNYLHSKEWIDTPASELKNTLKTEKNWKHNPADINSLSNTEIRQICQADENHLWIGTSIGLNLFNIETEKFKRWKFNDTRTKILNESIYASLYQDKKGILWAGLASNGLAIIDWKNKKTTYLNANNYELYGLKSNSIRDIYEDKSGLIWIATKFQGIQIYDRRQEVFKHIPEANDIQDGLSNKFVLSIFEDSEEIIWIGTKEGGLNRYDPKKVTFKYYQNIPGNSKSLKDNRVEYINEDKNGNLWLGTKSGIEKFNKKNNIFNHYGNYHIKCFEIDKSGKFWIGTNSSGLFTFNPSSGSFSRHKSSHSQLFQNTYYHITCLFTDKNNSLWIGTSQDGLYKYSIETDEIIHFLHEPDNNKSISGNMIRSIFEDSKGYIWIGTKSDGLNRFNPANNTFKRIKKITGLPSNTIYSILEDEKNNLWMGTHNGITKFNIEKNTFTNFNETYGLQGKIFEINAFCKTKNGNILLGGSNGLNIFYPNSTFKKNYIAPVIISSIKVYDKIIGTDITQYNEYTLNYNDKYISFNYAILDYSNPINNQYAYMLENFDEDWIYCGNRYFTSYTSLPPGEYIFKVKAANVDGDWNEEGIKVKLTIPVPYWKKSWFIALLIVIIITFIISIYLIRVSVVRRNEKYLMAVVKQKTQDLREANEILEKQKKEIENHNEELIAQQTQIKLQKEELEQHRSHLENLVSERTRDLEKAKEKAEESDRLKSAFLANMSHEIRTPLNAIIGFTDLIADENYEKQELEEINKIIKTNSQTLLQLINDIIDISKIEAKQLEIHNDKFYINYFLNELYINYQEQLAKLFNENDIKIDIVRKMDSETEDLEIITDSFRIRQIFNNLFSNALKFTKSGSIEFGYQLIENNKKIRFFMKDTGIGIAPENLKLIFHRFRKIEDDKTKIYRGTGLGLAICSNLARMLGGKMWAESQLRKGSKFYFEIPLKLSGAKAKTTVKKPKTKKISPNWENKTILLVEDEYSNFKILEAMLEKTGAKVIRAEDGISAVKYCSDKNFNFDLVLMDIKLPKMNGIEATLKIKEHNKSLPIVAQTAYALKEEEREIMNAGFDGYLPKPILSSDLINKLAEFI